MLGLFNSKAIMLVLRCSEGGGAANLDSSEAAELRARSFIPSLCKDLCARLVLGAGEMAVSRPGRC